MKKRLLPMILVCCMLAAWLAVGTTAADTVHDVYTIADLAKLENSYDTFYLRNDMDLTNYGTWTPINFYGTFDGQGHTIKGLTVSVTNAAGGLFNELHGIVRNLHIDGNIAVKRSGSPAFVAHPDHPAIGNHPAVSFASAAGVLAAYLGKEGQLFCVSTSGSVAGYFGVGGLLGGCHRSSVISDCFSTATITHQGDNNSSCGGLVGWLAWGDANSIVIKNCYASGTISSSAELRSNGLVGNNDAGTGAVVNSYYCNYHNPKVVDAGIYQTIDDMKQQSTYVDWNFSTVWQMSASKNDGFPYLRTPEKVVPTNVSLNMSTLTLKPEDSQMLQATILPANATARSLDWHSSDTGIVDLAPVTHGSCGEINPRMMVNAKKPGVAVVTAVTTEGKIEAACTVTVSDGQPEPIPTYRLNGITVRDTDGKALTAIPKSLFLATVSVTNIASLDSPTIMLAAYTDKNQFTGVFYVTLKSPIGGTIEATLPVDNSGGNIAQLKAFAVNSFADMSMIGNPVSFPA